MKLLQYQKKLSKLLARFWFSAQLVKSMRVEIGDLVFCHTIGSKLGWRLNQIGLVVAGSKKDARFRAFLSSGGYDEFTMSDVEKGSVEIIAKANGETIKLSKDLKVIPNVVQQLEEAADTATLDRVFNQRLINRESGNNS